MYIGLMTKRQLNAMAKRPSPISIPAFTRTSLTLVNELSNHGKSQFFIYYTTLFIDTSYILHWAESTGNNNGADHNLDLSLGNSSSKLGNINSQTSGSDNPNAAMDHHMAPPDWRNNGGFRPKVCVRL